MGRGAENLRIRLEAHLGAAAIGDAAQLLELALRNPARKNLSIELLAGRHLHLDALGQRIDDGDADAMQAAGGLIGARIEFAAGVQHGHDHFERRLLGEFRMRADGNAAAIVDDGEPAARLERDLDEAGVAGDGLVHGVVQHLGEEVMHGGFILAADIHARPPPDGLEPLQHLDGAGVIFRRRLGRSRREGRRACAARRRRDHRIWPCGGF